MIVSRQQKWRKPFISVKRGGDDLFGMRNNLKSAQAGDMAENGESDSLIHKTDEIERKTAVLTEKQCPDMILSNKVPVA